MRCRRKYKIFDAFGALNFNAWLRFTSSFSLNVQRFIFATILDSFHFVHLTFCEAVTSNLSLANVFATYPYLYCAF